MGITLVEALLVIGTFGICTGVWVTLGVIINQNKSCDCLSVATITKSKSKKENG